MFKAYISTRYNSICSGRTPDECLKKTMRWMNLHDPDGTVQFEIYNAAEDRMLDGDELVLCLKRVYGKDDEPKNVNWTKEGF